MKYLILKIKINGIKNIEKEIELQFSNITYSKIKDEFAKSHIKSIYGANGAGKTGIIHAVNIYKNIIQNNNYLTLENANDSFRNLINQKTKLFTIEVIFAVADKDSKDVCIYSHFMCIKEIDSYFKLVEEKLSLLNKSNLNNVDNYVVICHSKEGKLIDICDKCNEDDKKIFIDNTMNLLDSRSMILLLFKELISQDKYKTNVDFFEHIASVLGFTFNINVVLQDSDKNYINFDNVSRQINDIGAYKNKIQDQALFTLLLDSNKIVKKTVRTIKKENFSKFKDYVLNLTNFVKVFKENLNEIDIKNDENGNFLECELILVYDDGRRVNEKYESTGIKKIINLYSALCDLDDGKIVFIDEFDSNIHDVLLIKLISYIKDYTTGQFIFTTHNLEPMEVLRDVKHGIDFLSPDSRITSWTRDGNYSPASLYKKGLISYSPFNIEPFNFIGVFGGHMDE